MAEARSSIAYATVAATAARDPNFTGMESPATSISAASAREPVNPPPLDKMPSMLEE